MRAKLFIVINVIGAPANATMKRATRSHPLSIRDKLRNKRINRKIVPGERHYAIITYVQRRAYAYHDRSTGCDQQDDDIHCVCI